MHIYAFETNYKKKCVKRRGENQNAINLRNFVSSVKLKDQHLLPELLTVSFIGLHKSVFFREDVLALGLITSCSVLALLICTFPMVHHSSLRV